MDVQKVNKQGRNENTRRLPYYRKIMVKIGYKTTLYLVHSQTTDVEATVVETTDVG